MFGPDRYNVCSTSLELYIMLCICILLVLVILYYYIYVFVSWYILCICICVMCLHIRSDWFCFLNDCSINMWLHELWSYSIVVLPLYQLELMSNEVCACWEGLDTQRVNWISICCVIIDTSCIFNIGLKLSLSMYSYSRVASPSHVHCTIYI